MGDTGGRLSFWEWMDIRSCWYFESVWLRVIKYVYYLPDAPRAESMTDHIQPVR